MKAEDYTLRSAVWREVTQMRRAARAGILLSGGSVGQTRGKKNQGTIHRPLKSQMKGNRKR